MDPDKPWTAEYGMAFETSSAVGCIALGRGAQVLESRTFSRPRAHAVEFLPLMKGLCEAQHVEPSRIKRIYVSAGPGSFTGLRIGITAARMLAFATGTQIVAVPTLEVIAQRAAEAQPRPDRVAVILDAKRGNVYAAVYQWNGERFVQLAAPIECDPREFLASQPSHCAVVGEGALYHRQAVAGTGRRVLSESLYAPQAETVYRLGFERARRAEFCAPRSLAPTYIRAPEAEEVWQRKHTPSC